MKTNQIIILSLAVFFCQTPAFSQDSQISESTQTFKTYPYSDPDPVVDMSRIYPYFRFDGYAAQGKMQDWKIVTLENQYIKVLVAPEIGGKVLGAIEKSSGKDYLYFNKVIKFRDVAMRGAWTSGGVEFNFGSIGHAPTTASPVDYLIRENSDGSKSCFVAAMDLSSRTNWVVEIKLPANKAYFETLGTWNNPTDLSTSLYHWSNAAADAGDDLRFCYPGTNYIGHSGDDHTFPLREDGIDISVYGNNKFGGNKSYHVLGKYTDYFGGYWENSDFGFVHFSEYDEKPGKKIWMWSQSREGQIWEDLLTDKETGKGQYVEIQSGFLFNQAAAGSTFSPFKHLAFEPNTSESFSEKWFPVHKIGTINDANKYGALAWNYTNGKVTLKFCANQNLNKTLRILSGPEKLFEAPLQLKPLEVFETVANIKNVNNFSVWIDNERLANFPANKTNLARPMEIENNFDWNSLWGIYTKGVEFSKQRNYKEAKIYFEECLNKDTYFVPAINGLSELFYRQMDYQHSLDYSKKVLAVDAYNPQANFYYALSSKKTGNYYDALDGFAMASRSLQFRSAALAQMTEIFLLNREWQKAGEYSEKAVNAGLQNEEAAQISLIALRQAGEKEAALKLAVQLLQKNPLNHFAAFEKFLITKKTEDKFAFTSTITNEFPHESYLEIASKYIGTGLFGNAAQVLEPAPSHPIVNLWKAWVYKKLGKSKEAKTAYNLFEGAPISFVFPFREETAEILKDFEPASNWKTNYYLGLISWFKGRIEEAKQYFTMCGDQPQNFAFYLTRYNLLSGETDYKGENDLLKAQGLNPEEWRCYKALSNYYEEQQKYNVALSWTKKGYGKFPENYVLAYQFSKNLLIAGNYLEALNILTKTTILPNEGASYGRTTYREACLMEAIGKLQKNKNKTALSRIDQARKWPENLGVGKPYQTDERIEDYLESRYWKKKRNAAKVEELEDKIIEFTTNVTKPSSSDYLGAILLKKRGKESEAQKILANWEKENPDNLIAGWCTLKFEEKNIEAEKLLQEIIKENRGTLFNPKNSDTAFALILAISELN
ncbi:MAG: DUF5107 domain-containing protein [Draconibacterium sp.]|nr:DUF5107 domain-containing protein [Draconibacterium sp.]